MTVSSRLLEAVETKSGLSRRQINRLIEQEAATKHLPRNLAALVVAGRYGVAIHRYASDVELAELRGAATPANPHPPPLQVVRGASLAVRRAALAARRAKAPKPTRNNSIFVVHGRDTKLTEDIYAFLRAIGLNPMEWNDAIKAAKGGANPIVGDVINEAMKKVQGVMVLLSPDEDARLKAQFAGDRDKKRNLHKLDNQPRPNVIFEAGLALGAHSEKTILVQVGDIREISDIAGKHLVHLSNSPASRKALAQRLQDKLKFKVNLTGDAWLSVGSFTR